MKAKAAKRLVGGRYKLTPVSGTDIPLVCYFDDIIVHCSDGILARPVIEMKAGRFRSVSYEVGSDQDEQWELLSVLKKEPSEPSEFSAELEGLKKSIAAAVSTAQDPSRRAVLKSIKLPEVSQFPQAYRIVRGSESGERLAVVDWGLELEIDPVRVRPLGSDRGRDYVRLLRISGVALVLILIISILILM